MYNRKLAQDSDETKIKSYFFKGPVVFYPLLFAAFPFLFLYAHNISETSVS